ncbi:MAG TPA: riboflavin synthase [Gammaproteobacteria bacterium]|nr:riboflavin synthase [Gammaproteobacteria bacterium]|tara:strand:- start:4493 stop:5149 length:657 start_codon:yes stop_codon:yes gene_type:complete
MFTGIVESIGKVVKLERIQDEWRLTLQTGSLSLDDVKLGESIAVSGCCLTVVQLTGNGFAADVSNETLRCTTLGQFKSGTRVNLEKAMQATDRFGGHIVSGHVDGVGELVSSEIEGKSQKLIFSVPNGLSRFIAAKGSICIDGTSLTVNQVEGNTFSINVIPHTQEMTVIGTYELGQRVNLEVDLVARYLEKLFSNEHCGESGGVSASLLEQHGFKRD